jgi:cyanophycin synthetase
VLCDGASETAIADLAALAFAAGGRVPFLVEDALAAAAAAWALGIAPDRIGAGLASFDGAAEIPGRFTVIEALGATVVVDAFRNPDAAGALAASLAAFPARRRAVLLAPPANRRDTDLAALGARLAAAFDRVLLCPHVPVEPSDGALRTSLRRGISSGGRGTEVVEFADRNEAIEAAVAGLEPGDLVVVQAEEFHPATTVECVRSVIGRRADRVA